MEVIDIIFLLFSFDLNITLVYIWLEYEALISLTIQFIIIKYKRPTALCCLFMLKFRNVSIDFFLTILICIIDSALGYNGHCSIVSSGARFSLIFVIIIVSVFLKNILMLMESLTDVVHSSLFEPFEGVINPLGHLINTLQIPDFLLCQAFYLIVSLFLNIS